MTNEELQLKQRARRRLIGAVTLVTGLVVFLPMVLDNEPKPVSEDIAINIPSQDGNTAKGNLGLSQKIGVPEIAAPQIVAPKSAVLAQPVSSPASALKAEPPTGQQVAPPAQAVAVLPGGQAKPAPVKQPEPPKTVAQADEMVMNAANPVATAAPQHQEQPPAIPEKPAESAKPSAPREIKPAAEKAKPPARPAASVQGSFVVRLGAFSKAENAKQLKAKVAAMGIRNYTDVLKTASGDKILVRAGPYPTRHEAEVARDRLKAANLVGDVVPK